jgi:hypothetical protein
MSFESLKIKTRVIYRTDNPMLRSIEECLQLITDKTKCSRLALGGCPQIRPHEVSVITFFVFQFQKSENN